MKRILLSGLLFLGALAGNAQLNNVTAPDFTVTDINGGTHTLSEYLNDGKIVIMDISAAWCGPCWSFHNSHALNNLYNSYGPGGSDEVVVLFVEGDWRTPLENIYGTGTSTNYNPPRPPQGDWTEGTDYPIINDDNLAASYQIQAYPTLFAICPNDGKVYEINTGDLGSIVEQMTEKCGSTPVGLEGYAQVKAYDRQSCDATGDMPVIITNTGSTINNATVQLSKNGEVVSTETFDVTITPGQDGQVIFNDLDFTETENYQATLTMVNGAAPLSDAEYLTTETVTGGINPLSSTSFNNIKVSVTIDYYPGDIQWFIINSSGEIVHQQAYQTSARLTTQVHNIELPEGIECYTFYVYDMYGDGMNYTGAQTTGSYDDFGFEIVSGGDFAGNELIYEHDGGYAQIYEEGLFKTNGTLDNTEFIANETFAVYPNPTNGVLNFTTQETVNVTVLDLQGKTVFTANNINNGDSINLSSLQTGLYIAKINGDKSERIEKIVIK